CSTPGRAGSPARQATEDDTGSLTGLGAGVAAGTGSSGSTCWPILMGANCSTTRAVEAWPGVTCSTRTTPVGCITIPPLGREATESTTTYRAPWPAPPGTFT